MKKSIILLLTLFLLLSCSTTPQEVEETQETSQEEKEIPYSWIGQYTLTPGDYVLDFSGEETTRIGLLKLGDHLENVQVAALDLMNSKTELSVPKESYPLTTQALFSIDLKKDKALTFRVEQEGTYALIAEHTPKEKGFKLLSSSQTEIKPRNEYFLHAKMDDNFKHCSLEHGKYAWIGSFTLEEGEYSLGYTSKEEVLLSILPYEGQAKDLYHEASHIMAREKMYKGELLPDERKCYRLPEGELESSIKLSKGKYVIILSEEPKNISFFFKNHKGETLEAEDVYRP